MSGMESLVQSGSSSTLARMFCYVTLLPLVMAQNSSGVDHLLNWCIDSDNHKTAPGPLSSKFNQCSQWKDKSCCTEESRILQESSPYEFNFDHCSTIKSMSTECKNHFTLDNCFHQCSPNVGPWVVPDSLSWRQERYWKVPLCASDCKVWFTACAKDLTCTDNWTTNFKWANTSDCPANESCLRNYCPDNSTCQTIEETYQTAQNFCEKVWDNSWQYTEAPTPCMRLQFNQSVNPNDVVALHHSLLAGAHMHRCSLVCFGVQLFFIWAFIKKVFLVSS